MPEESEKAAAEEAAKKAGHETSADELIKLKKQMATDFVPRSELEKSQAETKKFRDALLLEKPIHKDHDKSIADLRSEFKKAQESGSNIKIFSSAVALRDKVLAETGVDELYHPVAHKGNPNFPSNAVKVIREALDEAEGDERVFTSRLNFKLKNMK